MISMEKYIKRNEGLKLKPYRCQAGKLTETSPRPLKSRANLFQKWLLRTGDDPVSGYKRPFKKILSRT